MIEENNKVIYKSYKNNNDEYNIKLIKKNFFKKKIV